MPKNKKVIQIKFIPYLNYDVPHFESNSEGGIETGIDEIDKLILKRIKNDYVGFGKKSDLSGYKIIKYKFDGTYIKLKLKKETGKKITKNDLKIIKEHYEEDSPERHDNPILGMSDNILFQEVNLDLEFKCVKYSKK